MAKITIDTDYLTGYRTFIASALACVFGVLATTDWVSFLSNPKAGAIAIGMSILMAILRLITHTPPGKSIQTLEAEKKSKKENEENKENKENPEINIDKTPEA